MREGGSYVVKKGKPVLVERTQPHPDGARARDAEGRPVKGQAAAADAPNPEKEE